MKNSFVTLPRRPRGFNLVELMIVVAIVAVLTLMAYNGYGAYVRKGEYAACVKKMKNFGSALQSYVTENQGWPDEDALSDATGKPPDEDVLWDWWYEKMLKYGITHDDWFCPTDLRLKNLEKKADEAEGKNDEFKGKLKNPSYIPAKFGSGFYAPFESPNQPWLIERVGHDDGMNKLMPNGTVQKEFNFKALKGMGRGAQK